MKKQLEKRFLKILLLWPLSLVALLVDGSDFSRADTSCPGKNQFLRQELTSRGAGILQGIHVTEAARVEEGALILSLDDRLLAAGLKEAQAALDMARVGEKMARDGFERIKKLKGGDSVSQQQIVESQLRLSQSTAAVAQAEAAVERLKIQLADTQIRAEIAGTVRGLPRVKGLFVQMGQSLGYVEAPPGQGEESSGSTWCDAAHTRKNETP